jgi:hypothetical protein
MGDAAAERVEHHAPARAARGVHAVEDDVELLRANARGSAACAAEHLDDAVDMALRGACVGRDRADPKRLCERDVGVLESRNDRLRDRLRRREAVAVEALEAVPLDRVVAGGDRHAAVCAERADHEPDRRRHRHADVDHIAADRRKCALHGARKRFAAEAAVARDHELRPPPRDERADMRTEGGCEGRRDDRGHRLADDAAGA